MKNKRKIIWAVGVVGLLATGGSAFTASNTVPNTVLGVGSGTVSGVTVTSLTYTLNGPGTTITAVNLTLSGDTTGSVIKIGFNGGAVSTCSGSGTFTTDTAYVCTVSQAVSTTTSFEVVAV